MTVGPHAGSGRRAAVALCGAAACLAVVGILAPARRGELSANINWKGNPWAQQKLASAADNAWLQTRDVTLRPLPAYRAADGYAETDKLALPNQDDEDEETAQVLASVPTSPRKSAVASAVKGNKASMALKEGEKLMQKANMRHQKKEAEIKKYVNSENPDVASLQAVRKKVFKEDQPSASKNQKEEDEVFAKAAREEAALKASLHKEAKARKAKHSHKAAVPSAADQNGEINEAPATGYKKGEVRKEERVISALRRKEVEDAAAVAKANKLLVTLKASRAHLRVEQGEKEKEVTAKKERRNALEVEIAKIKQRDAEKLAALSHKLNALNEGSALATERKQGIMTHHVEVKREVKVQAAKPGAVSKKADPSTALAQKFISKGGIKKAFSALAADEKADNKEIKMDELVQLPHG